jgi:hypothetical protein
MSTSLRQYLPLFFLTLTFSIIAPSPASAQEIDFPLCEPPDSASTAAPGLDDILHDFGSDTDTYPNEFHLPSNFFAFSQVFDLKVSEGVSSRWLGVPPLLWTHS